MPAAPELLLITTSELQLQKKSISGKETVEQKEHCKIMSKLSNIVHSLVKCGLKGSYNVFKVTYLKVI